MPMMMSFIIHIFLASPFLNLFYFSLPDTQELMPSLPLASPPVPRLTCLLWCMMPKVGNTQVLAGGTMSLSAKLTHCTTWAAASGVLPRSSSLLTAESEHKGQNFGVMPTSIQVHENSSTVHSSSPSSCPTSFMPDLPTPTPTANYHSRQWHCSRTHRIHRHPQMLEPGIKQSKDK